MRAHPAVARVAHPVHCAADLRAPHGPATRSAPFRILALIVICPQTRLQIGVPSVCRWRRAALVQIAPDIKPVARAGHGDIEQAARSLRLSASRRSCSSLPYSSRMSALARHRHRYQQQNKALHFAGDAPPDWRKYRAKTQLALPTPWPVHRHHPHGVGCTSISRLRLCSPCASQCKKP